MDVGVCSLDTGGKFAPESVSSGVAMPRKWGKRHDFRIKQSPLKC